MERVMGIEPTLAAWEAAVLPLNYTRFRPPLWPQPAGAGSTLRRVGRDYRKRTAPEGNAYNRGMPGDSIDIVFNDTALAVPGGCTVAELLAGQGLSDRRVAVEVNRGIVPRSAHATHVLAPGDRVEVVHALGGG